MLVTADRKFASKIVDGCPGTNVRYVGAERFAGDISAAAMATGIQPEGEHE